MVNRLLELCEKQKTNFSAVEKRLGFGNASLQKTNEKIQANRLKKLADYFGVTMEYLLTGAETPQERLSEDERELISLYRQMPTENRTELLGHARFIQSTLKKTDSSKAG